MEPQDVSGQIITLGTHGTRCRNPVGTEAVFLVKIPLIAHTCAPSYEMEVVIPTTGQTRTRVMLPGQLMDITLVAVEPAWPEITDKSDTGYFHRLRNRTRFEDLLHVSENRAATTETGTYQEPILEFEYHPPPKLDIEMGIDNSRLYWSKLKRCRGMVARDADLGDEMALVDTNIPQWVRCVGKYST